MKRFVIRVAILGALFIQGCTTSGAFLALNQTQVELSKGNYSITATDVYGEAESAYVLGVSYSNGMTTTTLAIGRVEGTGMLYREALDDLWQNYEINNGAISGKHLALTNVRYDADILNLLLYTKVKISVRADVIEFTD